MRKLLSAAALVMAMASSGIASAQTQDSGVLESYLGYTNFQPCSNWSYDFDIRGYKCTFTGSNMYLADYRDLQQMADLVDRLEQQVRDLEMRVSRLENH